MARQRQTVFALGLPPAKKMNPWPTVSCAQRPWKTTAAIGPLHREQAKQDGKPTNCEYHPSLHRWAAFHHPDAERRLNSASMAGPFLSPAESIQIYEPPLASC